MPSLERICSVWVRVAGAHRHHALVGLVGRLLAGAEHERFAHRLLAFHPRERVVDLDPVVAAAPAPPPRAHLPHLLAMQELMVHVHQVLVHERVVALDLAAEAARLVCAVVRRFERGERPGVGERRVTREHEDQPVRFAARIRTPLGRRSRPRYGTSTQRPLSHA